MPLQTVTTNPHMLWMKYNNKMPWLESIKASLEFFHSKNNKFPKYIGMNEKDILSLGKLKIGESTDYLRGVVFKNQKIRVLPVKTCLKYHLQLYY